MKHGTFHSCLRTLACAAILVLTCGSCDTHGPHDPSHEHGAPGHPSATGAKAPSDAQAAGALGTNPPETHSPGTDAHGHDAHIAAAHHADTHGASGSGADGHGASGTGASGTGAEGHDTHAHGPDDHGAHAPGAEDARRTPQVQTPLDSAAHVHTADHSYPHDPSALTPSASKTHDVHEDEVKLTSAAIERYGVKTAVAQRTVLRPTITVPARVGFNTEAMAHVGSPLRGRIAEVKVKVGDKVQVGTELAIIESPELGEAQAEYLQRGVGVQTAGPQVELSKVAWERAQGLYEHSQGISLTEVQRREAEYKASVAALKAAQSAHSAAANRLQLLGMSTAAVAELATSGVVVPRYAIRAAIDGIVVQREVTLGELVSPDREYLMVLADATQLWVLADVAEAKLFDVHVDARAWVSSGALGSAGARRFEGKVVFLSPFVNPTTRTAEVRIEVPAIELGLRPGMFVEAEIVALASGDTEPVAVLAVPTEAVQNVEGAPAVFVPVANEPGTFQRRALTVGRAVGGLVPVHSGLVEGETFVSTGTFILKAELLKHGVSHQH